MDHISQHALCWGCVPGPGGCLLLGGAWSGGACSWGVPTSRGGGIPACTEADPPLNRIIHTCENRTLPQLRSGGNNIVVVPFLKRYRFCTLFTQYEHTFRVTFTHMHLQEVEGTCSNSDCRMMNEWKCCHV